MQERNRIVASWNAGVTVKEARVSAYEGDEEVSFMTFDARSTTPMTFFSRSRLVTTGWTDRGSSR